VLAAVHELSTAPVRCVTVHSAFLLKLPVSFVNGIFLLFLLGFVLGFQVAVLVLCFFVPEALTGHLQDG